MSPLNQGPIQHYSIKALVEQSPVSLRRRRLRSVTAIYLPFLALNYFSATIIVGYFSDVNATYCVMPLMLYLKKLLK